MNTYHLTHIRVLLLFTCAILMNFKSFGQSRIPSNLKDWYELETGEVFKQSTTTESIRIAPSCTNELLYIQNSNGDNIENGGAISPPNFGTRYDDFLITNNSSIDQVTTYLLYLLRGGVFDPNINIQIDIISDNGGTPDLSNIICSELINGNSINPIIVGNVFGGIDIIEATMTLSTPCRLSAGTYWLCISTNNTFNNVVFWEMINSGGPVIGSESYSNYLNQGVGGLQTGSIQTGIVSDHAFALCGNECNPNSPVIIPNGPRNK